MFGGGNVPSRLNASLVCLVCAGALLLAGVARAEEPKRLSIASDGACPSAEAVAEELRELLPDVALESSAESATTDVVVADRGAAFSVKVRDQRRRFRDPKRDCTERARHVAVFAALVIDPLHVPSHVVEGGEEEPEPAEKPPEIAPVAAPPAAPPEKKAGGAALDLSLGPLVQVALRSEAESTTQAGGLGLRLRYGSRLGLSLGVAGLLPTSLQFPDAEARCTWLPMDLGVSLATRGSSWEAVFDVGVAAALLFVEGEALDTTQRASRLELGGRAGVQVRYWASERAGVFAGLSGTWYPKPYTLEVQGLGVVGETPKGWVSASLGAVLRL